MADFKAQALWVDDEMEWLSGYSEALADLGINVDFVDSIDIAMSKLKKPVRYALVIWDMSMPTGTFRGQSGLNGGSTTGLVFHEWVREQYPDLKMLLFTNFRGFVAVWNTHTERDYALAKRDCLPVEFAEQVRRIIEKRP